MNTLTTPQNTVLTQLDKDTPTSLIYRRAARRTRRANRAL